jgi:hypothetical protein
MSSLMGIETEYGFTVLGTNGKHPDTTARDLLQAMRARWPHLCDGTDGLVFANGSRFYLDQGKPKLWIKGDVATVRQAKPGKGGSM